MEKYNILVIDAEFKLSLAKRRHEVLNHWLEVAENRLEKAEQNYYDKSMAVCNHEKILRSLAAKLGWEKRKIKWK